MDLLWLRKHGLLGTANAGAAAIAGGARIVQYRNKIAPQPLK